jgi:hypothetical protein
MFPRSRSAALSPGADRSSGLHSSRVLRVLPLCYYLSSRLRVPQLRCRRIRRKDEFVVLAIPGEAPLADDASETSRDGGRSRKIADRHASHAPVAPYLDQDLELPSNWSPCLARAPQGACLHSCPVTRLLDHALDLGLGRSDGAGRAPGPLWRRPPGWSLRAEERQQTEGDHRRSHRGQYRPIRIHFGASSETRPNQDRMRDGRWTAFGRCRRPSGTTSIRETARLRSLLLPPRAGSPEIEVEFDRIVTPR